MLNFMQWLCLHLDGFLLVCGTEQATQQLWETLWFSKLLNCLWILYVKKHWNILQGQSAVRKTLAHFTWSIHLGFEAASLSEHVYWDIFIEHSFGPVVRVFQNFLAFIMERLVYFQYALQVLPPSCISHKDLQQMSKADLGPSQVVCMTAGVIWGGITGKVKAFITNKYFRWLK